ncbi:hypothetical protein G8764_17535 [Pseudomaricurvus alcaniphilus]|uniref:hypothetical protein n=1 Tax=Pseudomaricurvus alcaniphilus TaxID=1166482 RepID=UPI001407A885|nr:hypothetical protein [Pseudomaricurvus alcaniphilus]NHN39111.1 hypothetical protein [Pseudomaricurvus alcaniphilus]
MKPEYWLWAYIALPAAAGIALPAAAGDSGDFPSEALLEFLADWELPDGDWVAPEEIAGMNIPTDPAESELKPIAGEVKDDEEK